MNINKLYRNQEERIQDEMNQVKADALRKNILGGNLQAMMHGQTQPAAGNPLMKLFGSTNKAPTGVNPLTKAFGNFAQTVGGEAGIMSQSMALPHGGPKPPQRNS